MRFAINCIIKIVLAASMRLFLVVLVVSNFSYSVLSAEANGTDINLTKTTSTTNLTLTDFKGAEDDLQSSHAHDGELLNSTSSIPRSEERNDGDEDEDSSEGTEYDESANDTETDTGQEDSKFISKSLEITLEHIDFVMLRLRHISKQAPSNITELLILQKAEMKSNKIYSEGWKKATIGFNEWLKDLIFKGHPNDSIVRTVPIEYHIALTAYTLHYPEDAPLYSDFNKKTREVCSGKDIDKYEYKSFFKLLQLAIHTLGQESKLRSSKRFLYRGVGSQFVLEEGQVLAFQHFVSTSSKLLTAENFAGNKTLFEVQGNYDTAISINDHSLYDEEEVLFSPLQVYQVESKHVGQYYTRYVLISHTPPGCGLDDDREIDVGSIKNLKSTPAPISAGMDNNKISRSVKYSKANGSSLMGKGISFELIVGILFVKIIHVMK